MAATVEARIFTGASEGTGASAEGGIKFNREDTATGTTEIPKPTATGTAYSYKKSLALFVTANGGTTISNRQIRWASSPSTGLTGHFKPDVTTYSQATSGNQPADSGSNDATPSGFTALTTTLQVYDSAGTTATNSTRNGDFVELVGGVSNLYLGGAGTNIASPNLEITYDEA